MDDVAGEAPVARATEGDRENGCPRALSPGQRARTHRDDLPAELVAHDGAHREGAPRFEVRTAEPARGDPHQQLAGAGHRVWHRPQLEGSALSADRGPHDSLAPGARSHDTSRSFFVHDCH